MYVQILPMTQKLKNSPQCIFYIIFVRVSATEHFLLPRRRHFQRMLWHFQRALQKIWVFLVAILCGQRGFSFFPIYRLRFRCWWYASLQRICQRMNLHKSSWPKAVSVSWPVLLLIGEGRLKFMGLDCALQLSPSWESEPLPVQEKRILEVFYLGSGSDSVVKSI